MKKVITLMLVGLLAIAVIGPAAAKKKKKPAAPAPVEVQFFLRADEGCEAPYLSVTAGTADDSCYFGLNDMFNEYPSNPLAGDPVEHYVASDGIPLTVDASRKVTGTIALSGWAGLGLGQAEVDVSLLATIAGEEKEIGTFSESYTVTQPDTVHVVEFEMELDPSLSGAVAETLTLDVLPRGVILFGRGVEHNGQSFVTIPGLK